MKKIDILVVAAVTAFAAYSPLFAQYKPDGWIVTGGGAATCPETYAYCSGNPKCGGYETRTNICVLDDNEVCYNGPQTHWFEPETTCHWAPGSGGSCECVF